MHATVALLQESIAAALPPLATYFDAAAVERVGPWPPPQLHELLAAVDGAAFVAHRAPLGALYRSVCAEHDDLYARQLRALRTLLPDWQGVRADFYAVFEHRRHIPTRISAFIDFLQREMAGRVPALPNG